MGVDVVRAHEPGQELLEQRAAAERRVEPQHGHLLLDLAVAAQHDEARVAPGAREELARLALHRDAEALVLDRIVEVRKGEVLPDEQAKLIAEAEQVLTAVDTDPREPDHVHPRLAEGQQQLSQLLRRQVDRERLRQQGAAAAEHRRAVDRQRETRAVLHEERAEADALAGDLHLPLPVGEHEPDVVQRCLAMRVGPPELGTVHTGAAEDAKARPVVLELELLRQLADRSGARSSARKSRAVARSRAR